MSTTGLKAMRNPMKPHFAVVKYLGFPMWECRCNGVSAVGATPMFAYHNLIAKLRGSTGVVANLYVNAANRGMR